MQLITIVGQKLSFWLSSERALQQKLIQAIDQNDVVHVKQIAPYLNLNTHFVDTGELPVFFALMQGRPEIADILVKDFNASVDVHYPSHLHTSHKTSLERACELAAKKEFKEEYLLKLKNYSNKSESFSCIAEERVTKKGLSCFEGDKKVDCKDVDIACVKADASTKAISDCKDIHINYKLEELVRYIFISQNSTHYNFISSYSKNFLDEDKEDNVSEEYNMNPNDKVFGGLRGYADYSQEDLE